MSPQRFRRAAESGELSSISCWPISDSAFAASPDPSPSLSPNSPAASAASGVGRILAKGERIGPWALHLKPVVCWDHRRHLDRDDSGISESWTS